jgi:5-methylcytosine-specific restriction endonuclease McrA
MPWKDKAKIAAYKKAYCERNKEKISVSRKEHYTANKEKVLAQCAAYSKERRLLDPEGARERDKKSRIKYARERAAYEKVYKAEHLSNHTRRARIWHVGSERFPAVEIFNRDRWICQICQEGVDKGLKFPLPLSASLDHIVPLSRGGPHVRSNVQLAHLVCNIKTGTKGYPNGYSGFDHI